MTEALPTADPRLPDAVARVAACVVAVVTRRHAASGIVWRPGLAVTSAATLWRAPRAQVVLPSGEAVAAALRGTDAGTDLAVLEFSGGDVPAAGAATGDAGVGAVAPRVGDFVFAVGRESEGGVHASFGHVGAVGGAWRSWRGGTFDAFVRLDGGLYPGLAGAAVAGVQGPLLGLASPAFSRQHGVVVPTATVERVVTALLTHGRVPRSHVGVAVLPVRATLDGTAVDGLLVSSVAEGGPAARGGLLVGDVIVEIGGKPARDAEALRAGIAEAAPGSTLMLAVSRAGQRTALTVHVAEQHASGCH